MGTPTPRPGLWSRIRDRFQAAPQRHPDIQLRSDVESCLTLLRTSSRRATHPELLDASAAALQCNAFGLRLLALLVKQRTENVFFSPCGIMLALSMMVNGSRGETRTAMARALGLANANLEEVNTESANLLQALTAQTEDTQVHIASSLWLRYPERMVPAFVQCCRSHYAAEIGELQEGERGVEAINAWVREQTHGAIDRVVGDTNASMHAILVNAVYFHSRWATPFMAEATRDWPFTRANGRRTPCKMMFQEDNYLTLRTGTFRAARLPYQDGFHMTVLLPHPGVPLQEMMALLTPGNWEKWRTKFRACDGRVGLPRFQFDYLTNLRETLTQIGMGIAFDKDLADFTAMSPDFYMGQVTHKAFVEVNEEGTTAAAVTVVEALMGCDPETEPDNRFTLILDRPFCCAIEDDQTGALLFLGAILAP